jgi:predicted dehydrogenase
MASPSPIRVLVLGGGYGARILLPALLDNPAFAVCGIWGRHPDRVRDTMGNQSSVPILDDWKIAPEIDAVALAVPPVVQVEAARFFLAQNKALLCEKPLAANWQEALSLASAAGSNPVLVDYGYRYLEPFQRIKAMLEAEELGPVESVNIDWLLSTRAKPDLTWNWKSDAEMGGGTLNMMGSHILDYVSWWFGEMQSVKCVKKTIVGKRPQDDSREWKAVTADDSCQLDLIAQDSHLPIQIKVSTAESVPGPHQIHLHGRKGWMKLINANGSNYFSGFALSGEKEGRPLFAKAESLEPNLPTEDSRLKIARRLVDNWSRQIHELSFEGVTLKDALSAQYLLEWANRGQKPEPAHE